MRHHIRRLATLSAPPTTMPRRRVVVTGIGLVTPLGVGREVTWDRLVAGESAVQSLGDEFAQLPCRVGAPVPLEGPGGFDKSLYLTNTRAQDVGFISFAMAAAQEALQDAEWPPKDTNQWNPARSGVAIGSGIGSSVSESQDATEVMNASARGFRRLSPFFIPRVLINLAAGHVSMKHGLQGPNHSCVTACASGAHSIGDAMRFIQHGDADVMVAGGSESSINPLSIAGFTRVKALSTGFNDNPESASRPFDQERDGFVMGEGAGIVVLEELEHAKRRGARIYAEVRGYGLSGDAHHITAPHGDGRGAVNAMTSALKDSYLTPDQVGYINAHATSTPLGDMIELRAIEKVFGQSAKQVAVSSTKGAVGHLLGAAGAVEAVFAILALHTKTLPPTANLENVDKEAPTVNLVPKKSQEAAHLAATMSNSFGFGGTNASLVFGECE